MRIALAIEYNGAGFCGWQSQPSGCGVQDTLERALQDIAGHAVRVHAAGRTDAGVHALSQIIHFDTDTSRPDTAWVRGANAKLPEAVRVLWAKPIVEELWDEFHARFSAFQRSYQYLLINQATKPALMADRAGWFHQPLDGQAMRQAAEYLMGEHDFSAFRAADCQAKSPIKQLHIALVKQVELGFVFEFTANAFLQHQVRNMVGALIYIGKGKYPPAYMQELLLSQDRKLSPPTFSPHGLYLTGVGYDKKFDLPSTQRFLTVLT